MSALLDKLAAASQLDIDADASTAASSTPSGLFGNKRWKRTSFRAPPVDYLKGTHKKTSFKGDGGGGQEESGGGHEGSGGGCLTGCSDCFDIAPSVRK